MTENAADAASEFIVAWRPTDGFRLPTLYLTELPEETMRNPVSLLDPMQVSTEDKHHAASFPDRESAEQARNFFLWWYFERGFHIPASGIRGEFPAHIVAEVLEFECV